jgi:hypothetical protein
VAAVALVAYFTVREPYVPPALGPREVAAGEPDPLAYDEPQEEDLTNAAALGLSHPLYTRSPGGVVASARRTDAFRPLVEEAVEGSSFDADLVEAMVFLESGGRPEVIAGDDPVAASGLTQILAETGKNFLGMKVDLRRSQALTERIDRALANGNLAQARRLRAQRRAIDERFRPALALAGTVRYLTAALERLGREDLAVVSYHMGIGNLTDVIQAYTGADEDVYIPDLVAEEELTWPRLYFDTTPATRSVAFDLLAALGDDSPTYYWRVLAAQEIMRLYREDPERLRELSRLHRAKSSSEEVLHPPDETERFANGDDLERAWEERSLHPLPDDAQLGFAIDPAMGELASRLDRPETLYRGLRPEALAVLLYIARTVRETSGATEPLRVTSSVRDDEYQELLRRGNPEAAHDYSLHTTGFAFDVARRYQSGAQAQAFQYALDALAARNLIAWIREPAAIHVAVASDVDELVDAFLQEVPEPAASR